MSLRDQLPSQWTGKTNVEGVVDAFGAAGDRVDTDVAARVLELQIDTATEAEIDEYLRLVGPSRAQIDAAIRANTTNAAPLSLALYRKIAKGAGAASRSSGSIEDLYATWVAMEPDLPVQINLPFTAGEITFLNSVESTGDADLDESYLACQNLVLNGAAPIGTIVTMVEGLQTEITLQKLDETTVSGGAVNAVTLDVSAAPANTRAIRVEAYINHGEAGTLRDFLVLPNGDEGDCPCSYNSDQNGADNQVNRTNHLGGNTALDFIQFTVEIPFDFTHGGADHHRRIRSEGHADDSPLGRTTANKTEASSFWNNLADALTSVEIRSTTTDTPGTLQTAIGDDSYFAAYAILTSEA